jgi:nicotinamide phosphoribosyltransferase
LFFVQLRIALSAMIWKPCTSATLARKYKKLLLNFAEETGAPKEFVNFQGHDFSFRGMSGAEDAAVTGAGHLTSFVGTDTVPAIDFMEDYYNANANTELIGCSVPATEHSVMTLNAKFGEGGLMNMIPSSVSSQSFILMVLFPSSRIAFDFWGVLTDILPRLMSEILAREGKVVIRPDSGDPVKIVAGYREDEYYNDNGLFKEVGTDSD